MTPVFAAALRRLQRSVLYRAHRLWLSSEYKRKIPLLEQKFLCSIPQDIPLDYVESVLTIKASLNTSPSILIDVGAFKGYFARAFAAILKPRVIVCFEPNPECAASLRSASFDQKFIVIQKAVSSRIAFAKEFFIHSEPSMSSLAEIDPSVLDEKFPGDPSKKIQTMLVDCVTLDDTSELEGLVGSDESCFLKIDVQGLELDVLRGAARILQNSVGILVEYMFCTPYLNQPDWEDLVSFVVSRGFKCRGAMNVRRRPNYEISGVDFLFVKDAR